MIITISFEVPDEVANKIAHEKDVQLLLLDALGEFAGKREPAEAYVCQRYPDKLNDQWDKKVKQVKGRTELARGMRQIIDIEFEPE